MAGRVLRPEEKHVLRLLGLPTFGLALTITVVGTYLPVVAEDLGSSTTIIGLLIGAEGLIALFLPLVVGAWSDRLRTPLGGRLPFMIVATPPAAVAVALLGHAHSLLLIALLVAIFFIGYFTAYEPYRALYPDLVPGDVAGRAQGTQALWRGAGTAVAIVGGGLLFGWSVSAPFVAASIVLMTAIGVFVWAAGRSGNIEQAAGEPDATIRESIRAVHALVRDRPDLRAFLVANALWELAIAALKTFVVLYLTEGLGHSVSYASVIIGFVSLFLLGGAVVSGRLADALGAGRVMETALWVFGLGLLVPFLFSDQVIVGMSAPIIGFGGAVLMTLPFALLTPLMPADRHGTVTGYYSLSRGLGISLGPLLGGVAITACDGLFPATDGYSAVWGVCAVAVLCSIPLVRALRRSAPAADVLS